MESVTIDVSALDNSHRQALEEVIGQPLGPGQRLVIQVDSAPTVDTRPRQTLEDWAKVYAGLSEEEIDEIDAMINMRTSRSRDIP